MPRIVLLRSSRKTARDSSTEVSSVTLLQPDSRQKMRLVRRELSRHWVLRSMTLVMKQR